MRIEEAGGVGCGGELWGGNRACLVRFVIQTQAQDWPPEDMVAHGNDLQKRKGRSRQRALLCLLFLNCLQLKIILTAKGHVLGWHVLISFISKKKQGNFIQSCRLLELKGSDIQSLKKIYFLILHSLAKQGIRVSSPMLTSFTTNSRMT